MPDVTPTIPTAAGLWSAVTAPERLARWYGHVSGDLVEGGGFRVRIDGPDIDSIGRVLECRPPSFLDKIAAYGVGWQLHAEALSSVVTGQDPPDIATRWAELAGHHEALASRLTWRSRAGR